MGKSKRAWKQIEDPERDELLESAEDTAKHLDNSNLFFVDAKGNTGGIQDTQRRKKQRALEASAPSEKDVVMTDFNTVVRQPGSQLPRWKKRHAAWTATKQANKQDDKERKANLGKAGMKFNPDLELQDIWAESQNPEKGVQLEKVRNKGFEVDVTPLESRKRVYMRPRDKKHTERAKELVDTSGLKVCPSGASFNPDEDERQAALQVAHAIDEKERAQLAKINEQLNPPSNIVENALPAEDDESELFPSKKAAKPKTKAQKNAKLRQRQEDLNKDKEKTQAKMGKQIERLGSIISEVKNDEKKFKARKEALDKLKENPNHRPKTSKHNFVPAFPEVALEHELSKERSMRETAVSTLLLRDQFKRFQEKNVIETRVRITGLKYKNNRKAFTRKSHRDQGSMFPCKASKT